LDELGLTGGDPSRTAALAAPGLPPLADHEEGHAEGGRGVGPPPAEGRVQADAGERDDGEPPAERRLQGVALERAAAERPREVANSEVI